MALSSRVRPALVAALIVLAVLSPSRADAIPTQTLVLVSSDQKIAEHAPHLSLFAYYYTRTGVSLLGLYAGPRWTFGNLGVELKTGIYGGEALEARAIVNNQLDYTTKHVSLTWFTDWYPPDMAYSYFSAFIVLGPMYVGGVADATQDWGLHQTTVSRGPSLGVGTKNLYFGCSYLVSNRLPDMIRMTVAVTL